MTVAVRELGLTAPARARMVSLGRHQHGGSRRASDEQGHGSGDGRRATPNAPGGRTGRCGPRRRARPVGRRGHRAAVGLGPRPGRTGATTTSCSSPPTACAGHRRASYADQGVVPGFRELLRHGAQASGNGLLTQAPPNTGAGWFTLATGAWPGVHGSTNNTFHINGAAVFGNPTVRDRGVRPRRAAGRDARPGGRARRQEGRPDRVGRRPQRRDRRADASTSAASVSGRGVATNYIAPTDSPTSRTSFGLQFDHPAGFAGQPRVPAGGAVAGHRLDERARARTARRRRCACACSTSASTSTASTPTSTTAATTAARATTASCSRPRRTATTRSATCARASGPTSRSRSRRPAR